MAHPVNWFQIEGKDGKPLQAFYKKVFAWKLDAGPDGMAMVKGEKGGISGHIASSQDGQPNLSVYVGVENLEKQLQKIEGAGGRQAMPAMDLPGGMGRISSFIDPAGNSVGLWQAPKKAAKKAAKRSAKAAKKPAKKAAKKAGKRR